jgi:hypothetical protein
MKIQKILFQKQLGQIRRFKCHGLVLYGRLKYRLSQRQGFGLNEVIGIAAGIIIAVVVVIPGLQTFAGSILDNLTSWWDDMAANVFTTP